MVLVLHNGSYLVYPKLLYELFIFSILLWKISKIDQNLLFLLNFGIILFILFLNFITWTHDITILEFLPRSSSGRIGRNRSASFIFVCYCNFLYFLSETNSSTQNNRKYIPLFLTHSLSCSTRPSAWATLFLGNPSQVARSCALVSPSAHLGPLSSHAISIPVIFRTSSQGPKPESNRFG